MTFRKVFRRHRRAALCVCACLLSGGCAVEGLGDVGGVSAELAARTGRGLGDATTGETTWPPGVSPADGLSEDELVALALWNNASFRESLADLGLSRADLAQAGMLPNPTVWTLFPGGVKPFELMLRYPVEAFWLRPARMEIAEQEVERTIQRLVQNGLDLIRDMRVACAELASARERAELAATMAKLAQDTAELTRARLRAGDATELETASAQADARQAKEQQDRLRSEADIAGERLRSLAGLAREHWPTKIIVDPLSSAAPGDPEALVRDALAARPDLRAAELGVEAAGRRLGLARVETFTVTGIFSAKDVNQQTVSGPGLDIALPIFNQNQGGTAQGQARLEKAARFYVTVRDRIMLDVREAAVRFVLAKQSHDQWRSGVLPLLSNAAQRAGRAYADGHVTLLFVLDAQRKLADARFKAIGAAADLRRARAELERSIGHSLSTPSRIQNART
ncbi:MULTISPECIES: TolC family protein [Methylosinus]|uniref:TolC family protein n=1 Tax=Methylosinus trichosporium (strain ATCC 35070 / NCIMB 11131 / UNIQEM 75 / OB3b) TaxID=595536 RepID=A0A2D2D1Z9_METT3|nr:MULTISPECIES: TolC family protein [Methylosinus]ATQ69012.1 TolC family protein [Methylosinus trichosporium OB3b]OBS51286.1 transporter [Methylosinus sp. 3S-1]